MPKRLLLTVGINDYPGTGADLSGCVNDSLDMEGAFGARGYSVTRLLDAQATKEAVVGTLTGLVGSLRRGDRLVVHYSGHGSNVADRDGDETDRRDECLVLHDWQRGGLLLDDELHTILGRKRWGTRVLMLSDSCHSGTMTRAAQDDDGTVMPARFLDVDLLLGRADFPAPKLETGTASRGLPGVSLMSGCADPEYSYDAWFNGRPNGAFSYWALRTLQQDPRTLNGWHKEVRKHLPTAQTPQNPQLAAGWLRYAPPL